MRVVVGNERGFFTGIARVGGLLCWENRMPLARWHVYRGGPQIWIAPTADDSESWLVSMRALAIESGAFVVSVPQYIPAKAFPADFPLEIAEVDAALDEAAGAGLRRAAVGVAQAREDSASVGAQLAITVPIVGPGRAGRVRADRSEEHTSEL